MSDRQRRLRTLSWAILVAGLAGIVGSGGGGGGTQPTAPTPTPTPTPTPAPSPSPSPSPTSAYFLLGEAGLPVAAGVINHVDGTLPMKKYALVGVDPASANPTPVQIEAAGTWGQVVGANWTEGQFDAQGEVTGLRVRYVAYVKGDRYYLLDQVAAAGATPTARLWTTLRPSQVCRTFNFAGGAAWVNDFRAAASGYLIVRTPGPDNQCGTADDVARAMRLDMGEADDPLAIDEPLLAIRDSTQAVSGHLLRAGNQVVRVNRSFASPSAAFTLENAVTPAWTYAFGSTAPGTLLYQDGRKLFAYRLAGGSAPTLVLTLASNEALTGVTGSPGTHGFVAVTANGVSRLLRIAEDGSFTELAVTGAAVRGLFTTDTQLVASMQNRVATVPKTGGSLVTVLQGDATWTVSGLYAGAENIFALAQRTVPSVAYQMRLIKGDGTEAATWDDTLPLGVFPGNPYPVPTDPTYWSRIYSNLMFAQLTAGSANQAGATLRTVDSRTRADVVTYGTLPSTPANLGTFNTDNYRQFGYPTLLQTYQTSGYGISALDLYLLKSDVPGLTRLTQNLP